jgi:hypothetical protein
MCCCMIASASAEPAMNASPGNTWVATSRGAAISKATESSVAVPVGEVSEVISGRGDLSRLGGWSSSSDEDELVFTSTSRMSLSRTDGDGGKGSAVALLASKAAAAAVTAAACLACLRSCTFFFPLMALAESSRLPFFAGFDVLLFLGVIGAMMAVACQLGDTRRSLLVAVE